MPDIVPEKVHNNIWEIKINGPYSDILSAICCITFGTGAKADSWWICLINLKKTKTCFTLRSQNYQLHKCEFCISIVLTLRVTRKHFHSPHICVTSCIMKMHSTGSYASKVNSLSHTPASESVNDSIPEDFSKVSYETVDHALKFWNCKTWPGVIFTVRRASISWTWTSILTTGSNLTKQSANGPHQQVYIALFLKQFFVWKELKNWIEDHFC